jgi:hypothetical protein
VNGKLPEKSRPLIATLTYAVPAPTQLGVTQLTAFGF